MIVEVMGRHAGWIAVTSGIAGGAEIVLAPEEPFDIDKIVKFLKHRHRAHASFSIVVVAEGAVPARGHGDALRDARSASSARSSPGAIGERLKARDREAHRVRHPRHGPRATCSAAASRRRRTASSARRFGVAAIDAISARRSRT